MTEAKRMLLPNIMVFYAYILIPNVHGLKKIFGMSFDTTAMKKKSSDDWGLGINSIFGTPPVAGIVKLAMVQSSIIILIVSNRKASNERYDYSIGIFNL